jgi:hypothetical protein
MVKNIDNLEICRAAKTKSTQCHSYSGATIQHLEEKIKEHWSDDRQNYEAVITHAGTNNLVNKSPHQVAQRMESLIQVAKIHSSDVAVSSVIKYGLIMMVNYPTKKLKKQRTYYSACMK